MHLFIIVCKQRCHKQAAVSSRQIVLVLQGAFRAVLRINWFLLVHHLMFCTFVVLAYQAESIFVIKFNVILSCFATYEFLLYMSLVSRKVPALRSVFPALVLAGISFYFLTRLVQLALLIGLFVLSYGSMQVTSRTIALYWVTMILCIALIVLQSYTFVIYYKVQKRSRLGIKLVGKGLPDRAACQLEQD